MTWPGIDYVRRRLLHLRFYRNQNNLTRTNYYLRFWHDHREVPWALMANLVSRNAGYQMSDLERYYQLAGTLASLVRQPSVALAQALFVTIFAYLETGNFLILRDVLPTLEAYRWAKRFPEQTREILALLSDPIFDTDPFIISEWERFINQARQAEWFQNWQTDPAQFEAVRRMTFALVMNEQNQIEDRLVNPGFGSRYLGPFGFGVNTVVAALSYLELTRLAFPFVASNTVQLLIFTVRGFVNLSDRIDTGRSIFVQLFGQGVDRAERIGRWCRRYPTHTASRIDYNNLNFTLDPLALVKPGRIYYSPPLIPAWPSCCRHTIIYRHLHQTPLRLPIPVRSRQGYESWLTPIATPLPIEIADLGNVRELADTTLVTKQVEFGTDWLRDILQ